MSDMQRMLRDVMRTENEMTLAISGTGSAGMEAAVHNLVEPDDSVLICVAGVFGRRMAEVAMRAGSEAAHGSSVPWGEVFSTDDIKAAMATVEAKDRRHRDGRNFDRRGPADCRDRDAACMTLGPVDRRCRYGAWRNAGRNRRLGTRRGLFLFAKMSRLPAGLGAAFAERPRDGKDSRTTHRRCKAGIST